MLLLMTTIAVIVAKEATAILIGVSLSDFMERRMGGVAIERIADSRKDEKPACNEFARGFAERPSLPFTLIGSGGGAAGVAFPDTAVAGDLTVLDGGIEVAARRG